MATKEPGKPAVLVGGSGALALVLVLAGYLSTQNEGTRTDAYPDPLHGWAVPTICMGETGPHVVRGMHSTIEECRARMKPRHQKLMDATLNCMSGEVTVPQVLAVMDLADNVGISPVCKSTMLGLQREGLSPEVWCKQFTTAYASYVPYGLPIKPQNYVIEPIGWVRGASRNCRDPRNKCPGIVVRRKNAERLCLGDLSVIKVPT